MAQRRTLTAKQLIAAQEEGLRAATTHYLSHRPGRNMASFTDQWMLHLHWEIFHSAWAWAGKIRKGRPNYGIPTSKVRIALYQLSLDVPTWEHEAIIASADLHWKAAWIHPFSDGNGRWSRLMANIFLKQRTNKVIVWPPSIRQPNAVFRNRYLDAIEEAVEGMNPDPLYNICRSLPRE